MDIRGRYEFPEERNSRGWSGHGRVLCCVSLSALFTTTIYMAFYYTPPIHQTHGKHARRSQRAEIVRLLRSIARARNTDEPVYLYASVETGLLVPAPLSPQQTIGSCFNPVPLFVAIVARLWTHRSESNTRATPSLPATAAETEIHRTDR